jgi:hypothetical protein
MIRKRYSDRSEIDHLRKKIEELRRQIAILPKGPIEDLHLREKRTLEYIGRNPGTNKEKVIFELTKEGVGSRMTIRKAIANLLEYGMILQRKQKDKPNNQVLELYVNKDSIFLAVYSELDNFTNLTLDLVEKITRKNLHQKSNSKNNELLDHLLWVYHHVLGAYIINFMLRWTTEIHDKVLRNRLYAIVLYRMTEILSKLSENFEESERIPDIRTPTVSVAFSPILQTFVQHLFLLTPETIVKILEDYKKYNMHKEVIPLIDSAWKIGFPMYTYKELHLKLLPPDMKHLQNFVVAIACAREKGLDVSKEVWKALESLNASSQKSKSK